MRELGTCLAQFLRRLKINESGASLTEYALLVGLVTTGTISVIASVSDDLSTGWKPLAGETGSGTAASDPAGGAAPATGDTAPATDQDPGSGSGCPSSTDTSSTAADTAASTDCNATTTTTTTTTTPAP